MALTLRSIKGAELNYVEGDANFSGLADGSLITALDASKVNILDIAGDFTATDVEGALAELVSESSVADALLRSDVASTTDVLKGDALVGVKLDAVGSVARTQHEKNEDVISVFDFMTSAQVADVRARTLTLDVSAAIQAAHDSLSTTGGTVVFPTGSYKIVTGITITKSRVHVVGAGKEATRLVFAPTANGTLITVTGNTVNFGSVRDLTLYSDDSTYTKIALNTISTTRYDVENVGILGGVTNILQSQWSGANSIGIMTNGQDSTLFRNIFISADRPVVIGQNPNSTIDCDHLQFNNLYVIAFGHPCVEIETGVDITHLVFDGYQPWVGGTYGLYWNDTTSVAVSYGLEINNLDTEQPEDTTGYDIYISHNTGLQTFSVNNMHGADRRGIYLRKVELATFIGWQYPSNTLEAFNADGTASGVRALQFINCNVRAGSTATMTALYEKARFSRNAPTSPIADNCIWSGQSTATTVLIPALAVTDNSQFDDDTVIRAIAATNSTTVGAKNARLILQNNTGTVGAGGEIVFTATSDTTTERMAAIGTHTIANDGTGATAEFYIANKALVGDTTLLKRFNIDINGNVCAGTQTAIATSATNGFLYVPSCAGAPSGVPVTKTGMIPIVVDSTTHKLYFYSGGSWRDAGP